jgi:hypothetical protein
MVRCRLRLHKKPIDQSQSLDLVEQQCGLEYLQATGLPTIVKASNEHCVAERIRALHNRFQPGRSVTERVSGEELPHKPWRLSRGVMSTGSSSS